MDKKKDNLELWNKVEKTDPKYTKEVGFGRKFTSVNAQYQVRNATEQWGLYGAYWGIKDIDYTFINDLPHGEILVLAKAIFFFPSVGEHHAGEFPISSTIKMVSFSKKDQSLHTDDEWAKKIETDITTKALSKLGFNADVFLGRYDDNRYVAEVKKEFAPKPQKQELTLSKYEAVMTALDKADEKTVGVIKKRMSTYADGKYKKLADKAILNKEMFADQKLDKKVELPKK